MHRGSQRTRRIGGRALDVPESTADKFNVLTSGSCVSVWIWIAIVVGLAVVVVVVATVPNYSGTSRNAEGPTRTYRPSTTATTTTTTTTTAAPTTSPALVLSCPSTDYQVRSKQARLRACFELHYFFPQGSIRIPH
jgi:ABC-type spermidine/putrescine transport system permease subunit I